MQKCPRCGMAGWVPAEWGADLDRRRVVVACECLLCGHERVTYSAVRAAFARDAARVTKGERMPPGPKPRAVGA